MFGALKQLTRKTTTCCVRPSSTSSEDDEDGTARVSSNRRRSWRSSVSLPKRQSRGPFPVQVEHLDEMVEKVKVRPGPAAERAIVESAPPTRSDDEPTALRQPGARKPSMSSSSHRKPSLVGGQLRHRSSASTVVSAVSAKLAAAISAGERGSSKMHSRSSSRSHSRTGSMATKRGHRRNDSCTSVLGEEYLPPLLSTSEE
jgi:hypothetical protein